MVQLVMGWLLTCGPLALMLAAWVKLYRVRQGQWPRPVTLIAISVVSLNAAFAAGSFVYYHFKPSLPSLPPWQDPQILNLAMLFLLAPIGMIIGFIAAARGAPKSLICILEIASVPLFVVGLFACAAV